MAACRRAYKEVVNLTDGFVGIVDDASTNDFGRAKARRQLMHIDLGELHGLWNALCFACAARKPTPIIAALASSIVSSSLFSMGGFRSLPDQWFDVANGSGSCIPSDDATDPRKQEHGLARS